MLTPGGHPVRIPILMYHKVGAPVRSPADRSLNVPAADLAKQMRLLARLGYRGITLAETVDALSGCGPAPRRPVCVTFDDGYATVAQHAAPVLAALGWPATVFVPSACVGRTNEWDMETGRAILPILDWAGLRGLLDEGWEMAGHTRTHAHLDRMADDEATAEIAGGAADLRERLGCDVRTFCYPYGGLNERTPDLVRACGLSGACTTRSGAASPSHDMLRLPRVKVAPRDGVAGLLYRLWLRPRLGR
jgi:peptidoglycan/xylan/chitin deacetylase (PgdA/CDA1 family)